MHNRRCCFISGLLLALACLVGLLAAADWRVLALARNSLLLSVGTGAISLPIGIILALLLTRTDMPLRRTLGGLLVTMMFLPLYLQAAAWSAGFGKLGWYSLNEDSLAAPLLHGWGAVIWIHAMAAVPWVTAIVGTVLHMSEPELEEGALLDMPAWRVCWHVTLRRAVPGVSVAGIWVTLTCVAEMTVTDLYQIRTLAEELYTGFAMTTGGEPTFGAKTGLLCTGILIGLALMALDVLVVAAEHAQVRRPFLFSLGRWRWPLLVLAVSTVMVLVAVPIGSLVFQAGLQVQQVAGRPVHGWEWTQFAELLVPLPSSYRYSALWQFADVYWWSGVVGASSASLTMIMVVPLSWYARRGQWRLLPAAVAASVGLATMGPLVGLAVSELFSLTAHPIVVWFRDRTIAAPVLVATVRSMPLPILISFVAFRSLPSETLDAAILDGAGPVKRLWWLGIRQCTSAIGVAWLVAFALACGEMSATIMVNPPGITTVPIRVFRLLHSGVRNQVAAICLTSLLVLAALALASMLLVSRSISIGRRANVCDNDIS